MLRKPRSSVRFHTILATTALAAVACSTPPEPPIYQSVPVQRRDVVVTVRALGTVQPVDSTPIKSKAAGQVLRVAVSPGDVVRDSQVLVQIDPRPAQYALQQARANLAAAQAGLRNAQAATERTETLFDSDAVTPAENDSVALVAATAEATVVKDKAALQNAQIAFDNTTIRAPDSGVVLKVNVAAGSVIPSATSMVGSNVALLTLARLDTVDAIAAVNEHDIGKLAEGMPATVVADAYRGRTFTGTVRQIEPQGFQQNNQTMFRVHIGLANPGQLLKPGMNASVIISVGQSRSGMVVPNSALRTTAGVPTAVELLGLNTETVSRQLGDSTGAGFGREGRGGRGDWPGAGGGRGDGRRGQGPASHRGYTFGGNYIVFAKRNGVIRAVPIHTGISDLNYSVVASGDLTMNDTLLVLPTAGLIRSQQSWQARMKRRFGGLPGTRR